jgi:hypothetical protein
MKLSLAARKLITSIIVVSLVFAAAGVSAAIFHQCTDGCTHIIEWIKPVPFALGVILVAGLNIVKVFMIERTVNKTAEIGDVGTGKTYIRLQYLARFGLTAVVLIVAALVDFIDIWGAVAGVIAFQIAAFSLKFMKIEDEKEGD